MTTYLEVLNHVLSVVGETPVSNPASNHPTAISARVVIDRVSKQTQLRGWWFNKEESLLVTPDANGELILPSNTLKVDARDTRSTLVKRGTKLYDTKQHTFNIAASVLVDLVVQLNIEDLPETAAMVIQHRSAYDFYVNDDGDEQKSERLLLAWEEARRALNSEELQAADVNALGRPATYRLRAGIGQYGNSTNPNVPGGR